MDILELSEFLCPGVGHLPYQHGTGLVDGERIRPETDTENGREAID